MPASVSDCRHGLAAVQYLHGARNRARPGRRGSASATVALTNTGTNITSRTTANEAGLYVFAGVLPVPYRLVVEAAGMRKYEAALTAQAQQVVVVDPALSIGETPATIEVRDVTPVVTGDGARRSARCSNGSASSSCRSTGARRPPCCKPHDLKQIELLDTTGMH